LAGKELAQFKANELRLPNQNQSFDAVLQVLALISEYNQLVICFDELDLKDMNDAGFYRASAVANFVKELFENLNHGVILSVVMPGVWKEHIKDSLPQSVAQKMTTYSNPIDLNYLDSDSTTELVAFSLKEYYDARSLTPPHPLYPFEEGQLRAIGREKLTVREVLKWCKNHCQPSTAEAPISVQETEPVELAFTNELSEDIRSRLDNNQFLADAILFGFQSITGQTVEGVRLQEVSVKVGKRGGKDNYLNFKIWGEAQEQAVCIGVAVLQYDGGSGFGSGLKRLIDAENRFNLTRGCLIRSKEKKINAYFRKTYLDPLISKGGEFVELLEREIKPLIAIRAVHQKRESDYGLTEAEIFKFIAEKGSRYWLGIHNPLLQEILSAPSYQLPADLQDEPEEAEQEYRDDLSPVESEDLAELLVHA
jgi:hypothetical protein